MEVTGLEVVSAEIADRWDVDYDEVLEYGQRRIRELTEAGELTPTLAEFRFQRVELYPEEPEIDARELWGAPPTGSFARGSAGLPVPRNVRFTSGVGRNVRFV